MTLENNVFGHTYKDDGTWHYYSLYVANTANGGGTLDGWMVRNNTFEIAANIEHAATGGSRWVGNLGDWNCVAGMRYSHNVGKKCAATDKAVSPAGSHGRACPRRSAGSTPARYDFRLKAGSPAINAADPNDHPALDRDGFARDGRPGRRARTSSAPARRCPRRRWRERGRLARASAAWSGSRAPAAARDLQAPAALLRARSARLRLSVSSPRPAGRARGQAPPRARPAQAADAAAGPAQAARAPDPRARPRRAGATAWSWWPRAPRA